MNQNNKTQEISSANQLKDTSETKGQEKLAAEEMRTKKIDVENYIAKTENLANLEMDIKLPENRDNVVATNDSHFVIALGDLSLLVGRLSLKTYKVINLLNFTGKMSEGAKITHVSLSNYFEQNYLVVMTSNLQLIIFFLRCNEDDDQVIRFPLRICNKCEAGTTRWKNNIFYYAIDNEIHNLVFQELPNVDVASISNEVLAECCDYNKVLETQEKIGDFDVSQVQDLIYLKSNGRIFIYDEEKRVRYIYKVGEKDEKVLRLRSLGHTVKNEQETICNDYIISVTDKEKIYVHEVAKMNNKVSEDMARVASFDMKRIKGNDGAKIAVDDILISRDGFHMVLISRQLSLSFCFTIDDYYLIGDITNASKDKVVFPFFDSFFSLPMPKTTLYSQLVSSDILYPQLNVPELDKPNQLLFTIALPETNKLSLYTVPLDVLHATNNIEDEVIEEPVIPQKEASNQIEQPETKKESNLDDLQAQFNQITEGPNKSPQETTLAQNKVSGFLDLAEVERQMMENAIEAKQEPKKSFKEKLIQKKEETKQIKQPEEPVKQKAKKQKTEPDQFVKNLSELFVGFHDQLSKKVSKIVEDGRKANSKELQAALMSSAKDLKKSYNDEVLKCNEKILIPYFEKCVFKIFEKYSASLEKTYNSYCDKIESEITNNKNLGTNLDSIFATHLDTANKIKQALEHFMSTVDKVIANNEKPENDRLMSVLETIANNQSIMNNNLNNLSLRIANIERGMQHMATQQNEISRQYKQIYDTRTPNFGTPVTGAFNFTKENPSGIQRTDYNSPIDVTVAEQYAFTQQGKAHEGMNMESPVGESLSRTEPNEKGDKKDSDVRKKSFAPVFMNPFSMSMIYSDKGQTKQI